MQKTKHQIENEIECLIQNHKVERNKYIIQYFGKDDPEFIFDSTKKYGGLTISPNIQQIVDKRNKAENFDFRSMIKSKFNDNIFLG